MLLYNKQSHKIRDFCLTTIFIKITTFEVACTCHVNNNRYLYWDLNSICPLSFFILNKNKAIISTVNKMCLWNTMPPILANSNEGQDHKDKYFDTSRRILSQEMIMYNMKAFSILSLRSYDQCQFFLIGQMSRSKD